MLDAALATPHSEGCLQEVEAALLAVKLHKLDLRRRGCATLTDSATTTITLAAEAARSRTARPPQPRDEAA